MKRLTFNAATVVITLLLLFAIGGGCSDRDTSQSSSPSTQPAAVTLKLAYRPRALTDITGVVLAETNKTGTNIKIELVPVATAQEGFARLNAGEADAFAGATFEGVLAQMSTSPTFPFRAYAVSVDQKGEGWVAIVASKASGVTRIADLSDKTVASLPTDQANWLLRRILAKAGVKVDPAKVVRYSPTNPIAGLRSGEHAAIFGPEPGNAMALAEGGVLLARGPISELLYDGQPVPLTLSLISVDFVTKHPEAYAEFSRMIDDSLALIKEKPDQVRGYFSQEKYGGLPPDVLKLLQFPDMRRPSPKIIAVSNSFVDDLVTDGLLKQKIDLQPLFPQK